MKKLMITLLAFGLLTIFATGGLDSQPVNAIGTNLFANPSVETATANKPTSWAPNKWGTNKTTFTYLNTGHTGGHSTQVATTTYSSGDAKWYPTAVTVKPNTSYTFTDWYQSNTATSIDAVITNTSNKVSYKWLGDVPASTTWKQISYTFKTPATASKVTMYHYIQSVGQLTTDDYSLVDNSVVTPPPAPSAPSVTISSPLAGATISGTTTVTANASDTQSVSGVQFKLDGVNLGVADMTSPYSTTWNTTTASNGQHTLTAVATNNSGLSATSTTVAVLVNNVAAPTAPTVSLSAPNANATVFGSVAINASASDASAVANVQFKLDGVNLGAADTTSPYGVTWDTKSTSNGQHTLTAVATNTSNLTTTSTTIVVIVDNPTPPVVSITAPAANGTVSGATTVTAVASDSKAVSSVQFKLDGANLGSPATTAPYNFSWDTTQATNGSHTLTAVATNSSNLVTTSSSVVVTVSNVVTPPPANGPNLLANPSVETSTNGTSPDSWLSSNWGANTSTFSYLNSGHTGNRSVQVQTTSYTNGAANWYYNDVPVTAGKTYLYSNWYKSNVDTEVDAEVVMSDGTVQYYFLGTVFANTTWAQFKATFTPPSGAKSIAIYQILAKNGYIISDDYSLGEYTPLPFTRGIVSVTFDDGWANQYSNAVPVLNSLGINSTFYIISGSLNDPSTYMTAAQVLSLYQGGNEIGSHSVTHSDMTTLTAAKLQQEFADSQTTLQNLIGAPVSNFAYPYGAYNANTITAGKVYYGSQRTVKGGLNTKDGLDIMQLKIYEVDSNISQATVQGWIDAAIAQKAWLILVFHEVATTPSAPDDALYTTQPADFTAEMNYLKNSGVAIETVAQALAEISAQ